MRYRNAKLFTVLLIACLLYFIVPSSVAAPGPGDGNLLKRAPGETCEACHRTNINTPSPGEPGYDQTNWNNAIKMHSGELAGSCSDATYKTKTACENNSEVWTFDKWDASGGWGVSGGQYGEFTCTTCHTPHDTVNIYLIKETITAPSGSFPGGTVDFRTAADGTPASPGPQTEGIMGDDSVTHSTSVFVCEVCHTYDLSQTDGVKQHAYNMTVTASHQNAKNCTTSACHSHKLGFRIDVAAACGDCHGAPPANSSTARGGGGLVTSDPVVPYGVTGRTSPGAHVAHQDRAVGTDCTYCHYGGMSSYTQGSGQPDSDYDNQIPIGFFAWGSDQGGTYNAPAFSNGYALIDGPGTTTSTGAGASRTCGSIYCHSNVQPEGGTGAPATFATPDWDDPATGECGDCHLSDGVQGTATIMASGDHTRHVEGSGTNYSFACDTCHDGAGSPELNHVNNNINVNFAVAYGGAYSGGTTPGDHTPGGGYGDCTTTYCHSQGQSTTSPFGGGPNTTATWAGTVPTCEGCHNFDAGATNIMDSGKHTPHMNDGTIMTNIACSACHTDTTSDSVTITNKANHVNQTKDVTIANFYDSDATPDNNWSGTQCSNVYCHSSGEATPAYRTIDWSAEISDCESCHNYDADATDKMNSGQHTQHINQASVIGTNYGCQECHNTTTSDGTSITTPGNHIDKTRTVAILKDSDQSTCTSIYCHSSGQATPTYDDPAAWTVGESLGCNGCHGTGTSFGEPDYPNGSQPTVVENDDNSHSAHVTAATDCTKCHTDTVEAAGTAILAASTLHTNETRNVNFASTYDDNGGSNSDNYTAGTKTCSSITCHGAGTPMWGGASLACDECHLANNTLADSHPKHYGVVDVAVLADRTSATNTSSGTAYEFSCGVCHDSVAHADGNVSADQAAQVSFDATIALGGSYTPGALAGTDTGGFEYTGGTCSTTYCHSQGQSTTSPFGGGPNTTATWAGAVPTCAGCHNYNVAAAPNDMQSGKHAEHLDGTITNEIACSACHTDTTSDSTTITNEANHVNQTKDVTIASTYDSNGTPGDNWSGTQCSNVYCHSSGEATPAYKTILWSATISDCKSCHNYTLGSGAPMNTGKHDEHINQASVIGTNYECQECHNSTTSDGITITGTSLHIDTSATVELLKDGDADCTTAYCHSTGQASPGPTYVDPGTWAGAATLTCDGCHGTEGGTAFGEPAYANGSQPTVVEYNDNSHSLHVSAAADCTKCHTDTVEAAGTAIKAASTLHTNQTRNVNFAGAYDTNGGSNSDNYNSGAKTCSAVACHGAGTPMWGNNTTNDTCTKCHGTGTVTVNTANRYVVAPPDDVAGSSGTATGTGEVDTTASTKIGAHQTHVRYLNGLRSTGIEDNDARCGFCHGTLPVVGDHADGSATPAFQGLASNSGTMSPAPSYNGTSCSNTYCHNPHGTGGTLNGSYAGTDPAPSWNQAAYIADGTLKTQANCDRCHLSPDGARTISGSQDHSGLDVDSHDCASCHGHNGDTAGASGERHIDGILWAGGGDSCLGCHQSTLEADARHVLHTDPSPTGFLQDKSLLSGDYGDITGGNWWYATSYINGVPKYSCGYCHPQSDATHQNGSRNLSFAYNEAGATGTVKASNAVAESYTQTELTSVTCSSVYCHSPGYTTSALPANDYAYQTTPNWYGGNFAGDRCSACHGNSPNQGGKAGSSAHGMHVVSLHFKDIYDGTSGKIDDSGGAGTGAAHGDTNVSTTINCHLCHNSTVTVNYNDLNVNSTGDGSTACSFCHDDITTATVGTMVVDTANTAHVDGTPTITFANTAMKVRAQMRDSTQVVDSGTTDSIGTTTTINDSTQSASWTTDQWVEYNVMMISGTAANIGEIRQISGNTTTQLTVTPAFPAATASGDEYEILDIGPAEIFDNWQRMNLYKAGVNSYEQSRKVLSAANYDSGTQTCSNVACHNQDDNVTPERTIDWTNTLPADSNLCYNCHRRLPQ